AFKTTTAARISLPIHNVKEQKNHHRFMVPAEPVASGDRPALYAHTQTLSNPFFNLFRGWKKALASPSLQSRPLCHKSSRFANIFSFEENAPTRRKPR
ncbi:MAG: hypothetical protein V3R73_07580, partial [Sphingomonadales bacterium]